MIKIKRMLLKTLVPPILAFLLAISFNIFAFTEPTATPPGGNVAAPLNVSSTAQTKSGTLTILSDKDTLASANDETLILKRKNPATGTEKTTTFRLGTDGTLVINNDANIADPDALPADLIIMKSGGPFAPANALDPDGPRQDYNVTIKGTVLADGFKTRTTTGTIGITGVTTGTPAYDSTTDLIRSTLNLIIYPTNSVNQIYRDLRIADWADFKIDNVPLTFGGLPGPYVVTPGSQVPTPSASSLGTGRIYFDFTDKKFKVSQNASPYAELVLSGSSPTFNSLTLTPTTQPTGTNGAVYYDSSAQKFKCYENGAWTNCIGAAAAGGGGWTEDTTLKKIYAIDRNVGIGTDIPPTRLSVLGNVTLLRDPAQASAGPGSQLIFQSRSGGTSTTRTKTEEVVPGSAWNNLLDANDTCDSNKSSQFFCTTQPAGSTCSVDYFKDTSGVPYKSTDITCYANTDSYSLLTDTGTLQFLNTAGQKRIVVGQDGYVGINGVPTSGISLEVAGQIKIRGGVLGAGVGKVLTSDASGLASWEALPAGLTGSGATAGQVAYWSGPGTLAGENTLALSRGGTGANLTLTAATGGIVYAGSTSALAVSAPANLSWDSAGSRLTATKINVSNELCIGVGADACKTSWPSSALATSGTTTANYIPKFTGSPLTLTNSQIYDDGAKVGIGTGTAILGSKLAVQGSLALLRDPSSNVGPGPGPEIFLQSPSGTNVSSSDTGLTSCGGASPQLTCPSDTTPSGDSNTFYTCTSAEAGKPPYTDVGKLSPTATQKYYTNLTCLAGVLQYSLRTNIGTLEFLNNNDTAPKMILGQDGALSIGGPYGSGKVTIDSAGKVGIGTGAAGPRSKLDVNGDVLLASSLPAGISSEVNALVNLEANYGRAGTFNSANRGGAFTVDTRNAADLFHWRAKAVMTGTETQIADLSDVGALRLSGALTVQGTGNSSIAGNVGIGTGATVPSQKLSVTDTLAITNAAGIQYLLMGNQDSIGANNPAIIRAGNGVLEFGGGTSWTGSGGTFTPSVSILDNGKVVIGTTPAAEIKLDVAGIINATEFYQNGSPFATSQWKTSTTSVNDIYYDKGNVGIGTTEPKSILDIGKNQLTPAFRMGNSAYGTSYNSVWGLQAGAQSIMIFGNNGQNEIRAGNTVAGGYLDFYTNNTADYTSASNGNFVMRLASSGSVGIGRSDKLSRLTVKGGASRSGGDVTITSGAAASTVSGSDFLSNVGLGDRITVNITTGTPGTQTKTVTAITSNTSLTVDSPFTIFGSGTMSVFPSIFRADDSGNNVKFLISDQGKVGIGGLPLWPTLGITAKESWDELIGFADSAGTKKWHINRGDPTKTRGLNFSETGVADNRLFLQEGGNVGIGISNPTSGKLQILTSGNGTPIYMSDGTVNSQLLNGVFGSNPAGAWFATQNNFPLFFAVNSGNPSMTVATTGNVGIGTAGPSTKLDVEGTGKIGSWTGTGGACPSGTIGIDRNGDNDTLDAGECLKGLYVDAAGDLIVTTKICFDKDKTKCITQ